MLKIQKLINKGALFVCSHSAGKDSQAMYLTLKTLIPNEQLIVVHADLGTVEWKDTKEHIEKTIDHKLHVVKAAKTFFEMVRARGMFPSTQFRQCTSDLKTGPINKFIRRVCKENEFQYVVNCMGLRAQESSNRAKKEVLKYNPKNSTKSGSRVWYDWLPIHSWSTSEVFNYIRLSGQEPHFAYSLGMSRLSCCFCIMSKRSDLEIAAKHNPQLFKEYQELEREMNHTLRPLKKGKQVFLDTDIKSAVDNGLVQSQLDLFTVITC